MIPTKQKIMSYYGRLSLQLIIKGDAINIEFSISKFIYKPPVSLEDRRVNVPRSKNSTHSVLIVTPFKSLSTNSATCACAAATRISRNSLSKRSAPALNGYQSGCRPHIDLLTSE